LIDANFWAMRESRLWLPPCRIMVCHCRLPQRASQHSALALWMGGDTGCFVLGSEIPLRAKPIAITENGLANDDKPASNGKVHDPERTAFLDAYLKSLRRASGEGVPVKGYFHWSLLDNFEWAQGFS
jgi:Glycosyl hydrolase family 1